MVDITLCSETGPGPISRQLQHARHSVGPILYHLNTAHTNTVVSHIGTTLFHHPQMLARRRNNDCARDKISSAIMLPVFDQLP